MVKKIIALFSLVGLIAFGGRWVGLNYHQTVSVSIFFASILGTLFFWDFRLAFAFLGTSVLLMTQTIDIDHVIKFSSLEVIFFLVGMMVLIALLKDAGVFAWIVRLILRIKNLTSKKFFIIISVVSALLSCAVDEVTSIIFMVAAIFEICDYFEVEPTPFLIISVMATNIGSSGTALGNPIGILIASKSGLTFEDFLVKAFPIMILCLIVAMAILQVWYRKPLAALDAQMKKMGDNHFRDKLITPPHDNHLTISMVIFFVTLVFIALHHRLELMWNLKTNTLLLTVPLLSAGVVMLWRHERARSYIEKDVEWWTLLFFMLLFAQAGTLRYTGVTDVLVQKLVGAVGANPGVLTGLSLWISSIGSSILDNVVLVAAFIPVIQSFQTINNDIQSLWWALLFGGCIGGNITMMGSTANIVALGILEKERSVRMTFLRWFWVGLTVGIVTTIVVWIVLVVFYV